MTPRLLRVLAIAQLIVAVTLWPKDHGIAIVFVVIAAGLALPRTPSKKQRQKRSTRGFR